MPGPPPIPVEQAELDALLDRKAVSEDKQRAKIDAEIDEQLRQPVADGGLGYIVVIFPLMGLAALCLLPIPLLVLLVGFDWAEAFWALGFLLLVLIAANALVARLVAAFRGNGQRRGRRRP